MNKYLGAVIGNLRRLAQSGMNEEESERRIELSKTGKRLKHKACWQYGRYGACRYGRECRNVHIWNVWESE